MARLFGLARTLIPRRHVAAIDFSISLRHERLVSSSSLFRSEVKSNIILIGSPGCGKTTVGKILADRLRLPVVDFDDDYLETYWNMTVAEKLAQTGSDEFVSAEGEALTNLNIEGSILSLSGSVPMNRQAMKHAARSGCVVFLDVDSSDIAERLNKMKVDRIVGQSQGMSMLRLLEYRQQFYRGAYDIRIMCERFEDPHKVADKVVKDLNNYQKPTGYVSTRHHLGVDENNSEEDKAFPNFLDVVLDGLAKDGGLYVPLKESPYIPKGEWERLVSSTYQHRAHCILEKWIHPTALHPSDLCDTIQKAYSSEHWESQDIVPVSHLEDNQYVMELFHGPTASFKDSALQLMPQFFSHAIIRKATSVRYLVLVATSGDTGSAVIDGFSKYAGDSGTRVMVLYPANGISDVQQRLMTTATGANIHVVGVDGDFDFCQTAIKSVFTDVNLNDHLQTKHNLVLSAANSINWGRLLPQIVHHASGYLNLVQQGVIANGDECDICIPTGNFGNLLAAIYAKNMGIPFRRVICASNENNVLTEFIQTGCYDLRHRSLHITMAPAIDILKSSNLERFLFLATEGDAAEVKRCFEQLSEYKFFQVSPKVLDRMASYGLICDFCKQDEYASSIHKTFTKTGYLMDPHTAVAKVITDRLHAFDRPVILCSTAHFGKFPADVMRSLGGHLGSSNEDDPLRVLQGLEDMTGGRSTRPGMHKQLKESLKRPRLHHTVLAASRDDIIKDMIGFVSRAPP